MRREITIEIECPKCDGTGLYDGMAERDGFAVVCHGCKGEGLTNYTYKPFGGRRLREGVSQVVEANPGIIIGVSKDHTLEDFGGQPYADWLRGDPFPEGSENRRFTCPAWWYQSADYTKKPDWKECSGPGCSFSHCEHFCNKADCWERWDNTTQTEGTKNV